MSGNSLESDMCNFQPLNDRSYSNKQSKRSSKLDYYLRDGTSNSFMVIIIVRTSLMHRFKQLLCQFHLSNGRWTTGWKYPDLPSSSPVVQSGE